MENNINNTTTYTTNNSNNINNNNYNKRFDGIFSCWMKAIRILVVMKLISVERFFEQADIY